MNIVLEHVLREIFVVKREGVAGGCTKVDSEELHDLHFSLNDGGW